MSHDEWQALRAALSHWLIDEGDSPRHLWDVRDTSIYLWDRRGWARGDWHARLDWSPDSGLTIVRGTTSNISLLEVQASALHYLPQEDREAEGRLNGKEATPQT